MKIFRQKSWIRSLRVDVLSDELSKCLFILSHYSARKPAKPLKHLEHNLQAVFPVLWVFALRLDSLPQTCQRVKGPRSGKLDQMLSPFRK